MYYLIRCCKLSIVCLEQLGTIGHDNKVTNPEDLREKFKALKAAEVDGVMVDCWWGLVEGKEPQHYEWSGYKHLFNMVREVGLKLQVCTYSYFFSIFLKTSINILV